VPVLGAVLIITAGSKAWVNRTILSNKLAVWFGLISFPLYLWHWPILSFAHLVESEVPSRNIRIAAVILSIALAWLTYKLVDGPLRFGNYSKVKVTVLVILMTIVGYVGYSTYENDGLSLRGAVKNSQFNENVRRQFMGPLWEYTKNDACLNEFQFKDASKLSWWFCMKSDDKKPTLILLGNSYANQLYPGFINNQALKHHTVLSIGTCDFAGLEPNIELDGSNPCSGNRTQEQRKFIDNIVATNPTIKFVIIDGLSPNPDKLYIERLQKRITSYESIGLQVILFTPHIKPDFNEKACFTTPLRKIAKDCSFPISERQRLFDNFKPVIDALKTSNPKVLVFEQNEIFCGSDSCSYVKNGMPLHRDEGHTSEYESIQLQTYFTSWAKNNIPQIFNPSILKR
jgi:hypothetical protein